MLISIKENLVFPSFTIKHLFLFQHELKFPSIIVSFFLEEKNPLMTLLKKSSETTWMPCDLIKSYLMIN